MNRIILSSLAAAALTAGAARIAAASCDVTVSGSVKQYWPSSGTTSYAGDTRCDNSNGTSCHLSGWLFTPSGSGPHPAIVYSINAGQQASRFDACEVVEYFVPKGYVVYVPYPEGVDDISGHNSLAPGEGFHNTGAYYGTGTSYDKLEALGGQSYDLQLAVQYVQGLSSVNAAKVALIGAGSGGTMAAFVAETPFWGPNPAAYVNLSGAVWDWSGDPQWATDLDDAAEHHIGGALYQAVANESAAGDYTATMSQFTTAGQYTSGFPAKLALYAPFTISSSAQAICTNRGYNANRCASFTFTTDSAQVGRWIDTVHRFLVQYGVQ